MSIKAVAHISQVRGGSQARIILADDGQKYLVKFQGNPQCTRVLVNDYLGCRLARMTGPSVPESVIILVDEKTILEQQISSTLAEKYSPLERHSGKHPRSLRHRSGQLRYCGRHRGNGRQRAP